MQNTKNYVIIVLNLIVGLLILSGSMYGSESHHIIFLFYVVTSTVYLAFNFIPLIWLNANLEIPKKRVPILLNLPTSVKGSDIAIGFVLLMSSISGELPVLIGIILMLFSLVSMTLTAIIMMKIHSVYKKLYK